MNRSIFINTVSTGLIVGTLDILAAMVHYFIKTGKNGLNVLKFVASGVFGNSAFTGGNDMMLYGLLFHYCIALTFTFFFFGIYSKIPALSKHNVLTGIGYGIFIWLIMQRIVVPLSNTPKAPFDAVNALIGASILILCIGLPLSFMAHRIKKQNALR